MHRTYREYTESYISARNPNPESFQASPGLDQGRNEITTLFSLFSDHMPRANTKFDEISSDYLRFTYHISNDSTNKKTTILLSLPRQIYLWWGCVLCWCRGCSYLNKNDLQHKISIHLQVFQEMWRKIIISKTETMDQELKWKQHKNEMNLA